MPAEKAKTKHILAQRQSTFILCFYTQSQGSTHSLTIIFSYSEYYIMACNSQLRLFIVGFCFYAYFLFVSLPNCSRVSKIV